LDRDEPALFGKGESADNYETGELNCEGALGLMLISDQELDQQLQVEPLL